MKIAVFSMAPLFPKYVHGGSQKTLQTVLTHLGSLGHHCTVYCVKRDDNYEDFQLAHNVIIKPVLRFKQTYPEVYYTAPYNLENVILTLAQAIDSHDVFYIHDGELAFHFLYSQIPTVIAFQDFVYPDTLANAFSFKRDRLILSSTYVQNCVLNIFSSFRDIKNYISVVPNGFDTLSFQRRDTRRLRTQLGIADDIIPILFPHRPDPRKGLYEAISALAASKQYLSQEIFERIRLLIPTWVDSNVVQDENHVYQGIYKEVVNFARELEVSDKLHIHPWIPIEDMPEYYSLGRATLCIGNFVEAFGNVSVESELCGTPSIISRVAAQRYVLPEEISLKVDYDDIDASAQFLAQILCEKVDHTDEIRDYVSQHYSEQQMVEGYAEQILHAKLRSPAPDIYHIDWKPEDQISIPPWCARTTNGYYNDYQYGYCTQQSVIALVEACTMQKSVGALLAQGFEKTLVQSAVLDGFLVRHSSTHAQVQAK